MDNLFILAVGFGAAIGTTVAWFPQVARTWGTRSARDFSWDAAGLEALPTRAGELLNTLSY